MRPSDADGAGGHRETDFSWADVDGKFAEQMQAAGVSPGDPIAVAVSGGADSMALCLLASRWKRGRPGMAAGPCDGLFGFVVDHGLRSGSAEEAMRVQQWVCNLGFSCDVMKCMWVDGVPALGHLQECARNARYALLVQACQRTGVEILLTAHHADDQAEVFILRLSRCSGIAGLAGMALAMRLYPASSPWASNLLLIRPLMKFVKEELYAICQKSGQNWVEDPTNVNLKFARNRIRKALKDESLMGVRSEIQQLILFCRKIRSSLDRDCGHLLSEISQVSQGSGHVSLNVEKLLSSGVSSAVLHRTVAALLQFVAQKAKPPRGRAVARVIEHLRAKNSKAALTVGGCNVFPAPGSKGLTAIICFSPDSPAAAAAPSAAVYLDQSPQCLSLSSPTPFTTVPVLSNAYPGDPLPDDDLMAESIAKAVSVLTLHVKTPRTAVKEFNALGLISEAGARLLTDLSTAVSRDIGEQPVNDVEEALTANWNSSSRESVKLPLSCGGSEYFTDRFVVSLLSREQELLNQPSELESDFRPSSPTGCCLLRQKMWIRHFEKRDGAHLAWIAKTMPATRNGSGDLKADRMSSDSERQHLSHWNCKAPSKHHTRALSDQYPTAPADTYSLYDPLIASGLSCGVKLPSDDVLEGYPCGRLWCNIERFSKAKAALAQLRNVPRLARRGLPVVVTSQGLLFGMPSVGYSHCLFASMKAIFCPRTPLGGAQASWL